MLARIVLFRAPQRRRDADLLAELLPLVLLLRLELDLLLPDLLELDLFFFESDEELRDSP